MVAGFAEIIERKENLGCGGLQPSELFSASLQVGINPARGVACKVIGWRLPPSGRQSESYPGSAARIQEAGVVTS
jgi:hypothetical protein